MGIAERHYNRGPDVYQGFGTSPVWSITTWLIAINIAVFVLDRIMGGLLFRLGYFSAYTAISHFEIWRFITFQFLHASVSHIFFNMLSLYFFGPMVERYLGQGRYLAFYLLCGMAGAGFYLLLRNIHVLIGSQFEPLIGASAGIYGILIAAATRVAPNTTVMLMFPPIPMKLRTLAWVMIGIATATIVFSEENAGGQAGHLGGAALGYLLTQRPQVLNIFNGLLRRRPRRRGMRMDDWR